MKGLQEEDQRAVAEGLSEEELAMFDILTKPEFDILMPKSTRKKGCTRSFQKLKEAKLILDWRKQQRMEQKSIAQSRERLMSYPGRIRQNSRSKNVILCISTFTTPIWKGKGVFEASPA